MTPTPMRLHIRTQIPKGDSLVGAYAQHLFRIDRIITHPIAGVYLMYGGSAIACDGRTVMTNTNESRTLTLGSFIAFHVRSHGPDFITDFELTLSGIAIDAPEGYLAHSMVGFFTQEAVCELNPSPETQPS